MFGWFKGLFGNDDWGRSMEMAMEMMAMDDIEESTAQPALTDFMGEDAASFEEPAWVDHTVSSPAEWLEQNKATLRAAMQVISDVSYKLQYAMGDGALDLREGRLLATFYSSFFYEVARGCTTRATQEEVLTQLLSCCPETCFETAAETIDSVEIPSVRELFFAMRRLIFMILVWGQETGNQADGDRLLKAFEQGVHATMQICALLCPGIGLDDWARQVGLDWITDLQNQIEALEN